MRGYRVLSLFGGIETGYAAMKDAGIPIDCYYSSEIDKNAIKVVKHNYPEIVHIGDVKQVRVSELPFVPDLLIGGFPCQDLSFAGKGAGLQGERSGLFFEAVRILRECQAINPNVLFLFENVPMAKRHEVRINETLGLAPWKNCASLVSAQTRKRLWWSNIRTKQVGLFGDVVTDFPQPKDMGIMLADILEMDVDERYYLSDKALARIFKEKPKMNPEKSYPITQNSATSSGGRARQYTLIGAINNNGNLQQVDKSNCIDANFQKGIDNHGQSPLAVVVNGTGKQKPNATKSGCFTAGAKSGGNHSQSELIVTHNLAPRSGKGSGGKGHLSKTDGKSYCCDTGQTNAVEVRGAAVRGRYNENGDITPIVELNDTGKANSATQTMRSSQLYEGTRLRRLTPVEVCRLFTLPDDFFQTPSGPIIAETNQYKALGNGWVMKVVSHIFSFLPELD